MVGMFRRAGPATKCAKPKKEKKDDGSEKKKTLHHGSIGYRHLYKLLKSQAR